MLHFAFTLANAESTNNIGWPNLSLSTAVHAVLEKRTQLSMTFAVL